MASATFVETGVESTPVTRPSVRSFDSGQEHSQEHLMEVRRMVEAAASDPSNERPRSVWLEAIGVAE